MQDQPTEETPQRVMERELRAAQEQVRRVAADLRAALTEDDRLAREPNPREPEPREPRAGTREGN